MYTCTIVCASLTVSLKQCTQNSFMSCPQSNVQCSTTTLRVDRKNMHTCIIHAQSMYSISPKYIMAYIPQVNNGLPYCDSWSKVCLFAIDRSPVSPPNMCGMWKGSPPAFYQEGPSILVQRTSPYLCVAIIV